ncbi:Coronatine-insensitive protein 1 [Vitis vinifera]|uniref:Coronatine-insensitive protein 1 n=1 Tax=Vitis vinifera TaxID=29760 RepID=A0A438FLB8_VITVI|nr:Coronatine-insensitive protein 1 [Vitis vinifera]
MQSRNLRTLFLEESQIVDKDGEWLHELAMNNTVLETLNFYMTELATVQFEDLELIARNCRSLISMKISDFEILDLVGFFRAATALEEFAGGSFSEQSDKYSAARNVIGDRGLEVLAQSCKKLRRLRIEREYVAIYVSDITNAALECIGAHSKKLCDFRLVLLEREERITDLPLDNGVRALLRAQMLDGCFLVMLEKSDAGLLEFSRGCPSLQKLEMRGCCFSERALAVAAMQLTSLRYLWVQGYRASETGRDLLVMARPFWNIELIPSRGVTINAPDREPVSIEHPAHILAYYSLAGPRTDFPSTVTPLDPASFLTL